MAQPIRSNDSGTPRRRARFVSGRPKTVIPHESSCGFLKSLLFFAAVHEPAAVQVSGRLDDEPIHWR